MKIDNIPRWFKSLPLPTKFTEQQIDEENGILRDVIMCQVGPAKGHGVHLETEFITGIVAYDQEHYADKGVKARFGHPAMSDTTMGTQMGVFKNIRQRGDQAIGNLHFMDAANLSPTNPGMKDWMMSMAKENPEFVMSSIVFRGSGHYQRTEKDEKYKIWYYKTITDESGEEAQKWVGSNDQYGEIFVEFDPKSDIAGHFYTDLVEAGAATDSLFSQQFNQDKFAVQAVEFVQEHPELHKFLQANPAKLIDFAAQIDVKIPAAKTGLSAKLSELLFGKDEPTPVPAPTPVVDEAALKAEFSTQIESLKTESTKLLGEKDSTIADLTQQLADANARITVLSAVVPEEPVSLKPATQEGTEIKEKGKSAWISKVNDNAKRIAARRRK